MYVHVHVHVYVMHVMYARVGHLAPHVHTRLTFWNSMKHFNFEAKHVKLYIYATSIIVQLLSKQYSTLSTCTFRTVFITQ